MEVVCIKKILAWNLLINIGLHCVRRSSRTVTTLATLVWVRTCKCITRSSGQKPFGLSIKMKLSLRKRAKPFLFLFQEELKKMGQFWHFTCLKAKIRTMLFILCLFFQVFSKSLSFTYFLTTIIISWFLFCFYKWFNKSLCFFTFFPFNVVCCCNMFNVYLFQSEFAMPVFHFIFQFHGRPK